MKDDSFWSIRVILHSIKNAAGYHSGSVTPSTTDRAPFKQKIHEHELNAKEKRKTLWNTFAFSINRSTSSKMSPNIFFYCVKFCVFCNMIRFKIKINFFHSKYWTTTSNELSKVFTFLSATIGIPNKYADKGK